MPVTVNDVPASAPSLQETAADARCGRARSGPDRCPGVVRPHEAADGLLARVRLIGGRVDAAGWRAIGTGARLGNGIVELTSRGNVQIRGLRHEGLTELAARLDEAQLLSSPRHERVRNIVADPLAGRRPGASAAAPAIDAALDGLDAGLCAHPVLAALPGRFLIAVDDGSGAAVDLDTDVRLRAQVGGSWSVVVGERLEVTAEDGAAAVRLALAVARAFLRCREEAGDAAWRIAELPGGARRVVAALGAPYVLAPRSDVQTPGAPLGVGVLAQRDGQVAVGALAPLGRVGADALRLLADVAAHVPVRVSTRRSVAVLDLAPREAPELLRALAAAGLLTEPGSGWEGLTACAGAGACASAHADVRAAAAVRASERGEDAPREHWSACGRRCGQTADVARAVSARADGTWDITEVKA